MTSPTQRTLKYYRELGFSAWIVEKWNMHARIRQDMFGFIDIVAIHPECGIVGVQATSGSNHSARVEKIKANEYFPLWCASGGRVEVVSWAKRGPRGKRKVWTVRREEVKS